MSRALSLTSDQLTDRERTYLNQRIDAERAESHLEAWAMLVLVIVSGVISIGLLARGRSTAGVIMLATAVICAPVCYWMFQTIRPSRSRGPRWRRSPVPSYRQRSLSNPDSTSYVLRVVEGPFRWLKVAKGRSSEDQFLLGGCRVTVPKHWTYVLDDGQHVKARIAERPKDDTLHVLSLENGLSVNTDMEYGLLQTPKLHPLRTTLLTLLGAFSVIGLPIGLVVATHGNGFTATLGRIAAGGSTLVLGVAALQAYQTWTFQTAVLNHYASPLGLSPDSWWARRETAVHTNIYGISDIQEEDLPVSSYREI